MKQANHNEVDLLLRSLARGRKGAPWQSVQDTGDTEPVSAHLDADELNSYAEGVAPAPARARYTEHLADCDACRGIVVGLSQAAGVANRFEVPEQKGAASFWQKLGALFSPAVLRFAVPAMVLIAVVGIGVLVLRQQPTDDRYIARNEPAATAPSSALKENAPALNPTPEAQTKINNGLVSQPSIESPDSKPKLLDDKTKVAELQPDSRGLKAGPPKDTEVSMDGTSSEESPRYAGEPKTAAPPPAPAKVLDAEKSAELAKEQPAKREDRSRDQDEVFRDESDDVHGPNRSRNNQAPVATQRGAVVMGGRGPSGMDKNKKAAEVETRTVVGRHFTREGGAWVDDAYDSSRGLVRVTRGSEQFRALIADEPGVGTIAEQLNGVVIVVWKGRAYRIQ
jgi:hypothetical protein